MSSGGEGRRPGTLQTLARGIAALEAVAERDDGMTVAEIAGRLGVDRAIAYRIVATLEAAALVARGADGRVYLGGGVLVLAMRLEPQLRSQAEPLLRALAAETRATAFLSVARGDEAVAVMVAEAEAGLIRVGYRPGSRHPLERGAAGIAILSARPERDGDAAEVREARAAGYSITRGQLQKGAVGIAAPLARGWGGAGIEGCVGVVALDDLDQAAVAPRVVRCAGAVSALLAG